MVQLKPEFANVDIQSESQEPVTVEAAQEVDQVELNPLQCKDNEEGMEDAPHNAEQDEDTGNAEGMEQDQDEEAGKQSILFPDPERINMFIDMYTPPDRTPDVSYSHLFLY